MQHTPENDLWVAKVHNFNRTLVDRRAEVVRLYRLSMFPSGLAFDADALEYTVPDPMAEGPQDLRPRVGFTFRDTPRPGFTYFPLELTHLETVDDRWVYDWPPRLTKKVKAGDLETVAQLPVDWLQCIRRGQKYSFDPGRVFVLFEA